MPRPPTPQKRPRGRIGWAARGVVGGTACLLLQPGMASAEPAPNPGPPPPFFHLRDTPLEYNGPEEEPSAAGELVIGWFGPSDDANGLASDMWWAARLAVEEANAARQPGPHPPLRLKPCWSADPWGSGVARLTRMVYEEKPVALIGSVDSASTHLAEQVVAKANLPLISPVATDPSITLAGVSWMFSCAPSDTAVAQALVNDVVAALEVTPGPLVVLTATDHGSRMTARAVLSALRQARHLPDYRFELAPGTADLSLPLDALQTTRPAAIVLIASAEDSARWVCAVRKRFAGAADDGLPGTRACRIFGGPSMGQARFRELAGDAGEGVRFPVLAAVDLAMPDTVRFLERFTRERGHSPEDAVLMTYDATRLLIEGIRQARGSRTRIRTALARSTSWVGIAGPIEFDPTGQNLRSRLSLATLTQGRVHPAPSLRVPLSARLTPVP